MGKDGLSRTSRGCACRIAWMPKHRRKAPCGQARWEVGEVLGTLAERMGGVGEAGGGVCRDHAHTCLRIAPRRSVGDVAGRLRGKGAMIPRERRPELGRLAGRGRAMRARGCHVGAVGLSEPAIRGCVQRQGDGSRMGQRRSPLTGARRQRPPARRGRAAVATSRYAALLKPPAMPGDYYRSRCC